MNIQDEMAKELQMLREAVVGIDAGRWRQGLDDYLIPARLYYHIFLGLEWLTSEKNPEEHKATRQYNLNWLGPVEVMPDQKTALRDLDWLEEEIRRWVETSPRTESEKESKALYFLRHTRQHLGELFAVMRLMGIERPKWEWRAPASRVG